MSQKLYAWILKVGVFLAFISIFLINKNFLFPFISSKQIYFNILIEILAVFWVALLVKYPEWRPKKSYITFGLIAFFAVMLISCFTGVDFNLSFWGDVERMLGFFHVVHFLVFYLIIITVMRTRQDWKYFLTGSVVFAAINSIYGFTIPQYYTTIGNTAYVAGYMLMNLFIAALLFVREKNLWIKGGYILSSVLIFLAFYRADISGAYVGLGAAIFMMMILYAIFHKNLKVKLALLAILIIGIGSVSFVYANKNADWVTSNTALAKITDINFQKNTFQTRLISWRAAIKDFKNHPWLGTGHGNYAIIFDNYFDPTFYDHTRAETYFDRAHNNLIDIASTTGSFGLVAYLFIFIAVAYYLLRAYRDEETPNWWIKITSVFGNKDRKIINLHEFIILSGLFVAYFVQNLSVFDSLVTYLTLMIVLGYVYFLTSAEERYGDDRPLDNKELYILIGIGLLMLTVVYQYNYKPIKMLEGTIAGQRAISEGSLEKVVAAYKEALSYNTGLDRDSRSTFIRIFSNGTDVFNSISSQRAGEILDFAIEQAEKNVKYNPKDSMMQMELAQVLITASSYYYSQPDKSTYYSDKALEAIDKSLAASPGRVPVYFVKAQIQMIKGEKDKALDTLRYAAKLNPNYFDGVCQLSNALLYYKNEKEGYASMDKCIDLGGASLLSPVGYVKNLASHYAQTKDTKRLLALYERWTELSPNDAMIWADLAKIYAQNKDNDKAKTAALKAADLNKEYKSAVDEFIKGLK